jgi:hypothetical protein
MSVGRFSLRHLFIVDDSPKVTPAPAADIDALLKGSLSPPAPSPAGPAASPLPASAAPASGDQDLILPEGVELTAIYTEAGVPAAPFPIEKLAKLIDGMNQLDAATKKTVVAAMDSADDLWDIASVVADGQAKRAALTAYQSEVAAAERAINAEISRRLDANQADKAARLADIDRQIAALQSKREEAITETSNVAATLRAQGAAATEAGERERERIDTAIRGFDGLIALFGPTPTSSTST